MFSVIQSAPMEGVTRSVFRAAHWAQFDGVDTYFTPFLAPTADGMFSEKEIREVRPAVNGGAPTVPQLLTARPEHFLWAARDMMALGYTQVDLNLGCPSGTVVSKHKGSGMLADPDVLDRFLHAVFEGLQGEKLQISVKTRIGLEDSHNFPRLMEVFNRYPICQLAIHPRLRKQFYKGRPDLEVFAHGLSCAAMPVCYNGDIFNVEDARALKERFPAVDRLMLGRGLVANPALAREIRGGAPLTGDELRQFHEAVLEGYCACIQGEVNVLHKMKELWNYWGCLYPENKKGLKAVYKSRSLADYRRTAQAVLAENLANHQGFSPDLL